MSITLEKKTQTLESTDNETEKRDTEQVINLEWIYNTCIKNGWVRVLRYFPGPKPGTSTKDFFFSFAYDNLLNELFASDRIYITTSDTPFDNRLVSIVENDIVDKHKLVKGKGKGKKNMAHLSLYDKNQHSVCVTIDSIAPRRRIYGGTTKQITTSVLAALEMLLCDKKIQQSIFVDHDSDESDNVIPSKRKHSTSIISAQLLKELVKLKERQNDSPLILPKGKDVASQIVVSLRRYWRSELEDPETRKRFSDPKILTKKLLKINSSGKGDYRKEEEEEEYNIDIEWSNITATTAATLLAKITSGVGSLNVAQTASFYLYVWIGIEEKEYYDITNKDHVRMFRDVLKSVYTPNKTSTSSSSCSSPSPTDTGSSYYRSLDNIDKLQKELLLTKQLASCFYVLLFPQRRVRSIESFFGGRKNMKKEAKKASDSVKKLVNSVKYCTDVVYRSFIEGIKDTKKHLPKGIIFVETVELDFSAAYNKIACFLGPYGAQLFAEKEILEFEDPVLCMLYRVSYNQLDITIQHVVGELKDIVENPKKLIRGYPVLSGSILVVEKKWIEIVRAVTLFLHARVSSSRCSDDAPLFPIASQLLFPIVGKTHASQLNEQEQIFVCIGVRLLCCWFESNRSSRLMHALGKLANIDANATFYALKTIAYQWGDMYPKENDDNNNNNNNDSSISYEKNTKYPFYWPWMDWLKETRSAVKSDAEKIVKSRSERDKLKDNVVNPVFELLRVGAQTDARLEWIDSVHKTFLKFLLCRKTDFGDFDSVDDYENDWVWNDPFHIETMEYILGPDAWLSKNNRADMTMTLLPGIDFIQKRIWSLIYDERFPNPLRRYILNRTQLKKKHEALSKRSSRFSEETLRAYNACVRPNFIVKEKWDEKTIKDAIIVSRCKIQTDVFRPQRQGSRTFDDDEDPDAVLLQKMENKDLISEGAITPSAAKTRWYAKKSKNKGSKQIMEHSIYNIGNTNIETGTILGKMASKFTMDSLTCQYDEFETGDGFIVMKEGETESEDYLTESEIMSDDDNTDDDVDDVDDTDNENNLNSSEFISDGAIESDNEDEDEDEDEEEEEEEGYKMNNPLIIQQDSNNNDSLNQNNKEDILKENGEILSSDDDDDCDDKTENESDAPEIQDAEFVETLFEETGIDLGKDGMTSGLAVREIYRKQWNSFITQKRSDDEYDDDDSDSGDDEKTQGRRSPYDWRADLAEAGMYDLDKEMENIKKPFDEEQERKLLVDLCLMCERAGITKDRMERSWFRVNWEGISKESILGKKGLDFPVIIDKESYSFTTEDNKNNKRRKLSAPLYPPRRYRNSLPVFRLYPKHTRIYGEAASTMIPDLSGFFQKKIETITRNS